RRLAERALAAGPGKNRRRSRGVEARPDWPRQFRLPNHRFDVRPRRMSLMDVVAHNRSAWDRQVAKGNRWTVPVGPDIIAAARRGDWAVVLTPTRPVPRDWFPELRGLDVLCLACGGGQQAPVFAAAGASVTVLDLSPGQLAQDRLVADRE